MHQGLPSQAFCSKENGFVFFLNWRRCHCNLGRPFNLVLFLLLYTNLQIYICVSFLGLAYIDKPIAHLKIEKKGYRRLEVAKLVTVGVAENEWLWLTSSLVYHCPYAITAGSKRHRHKSRRRRITPAKSCCVIANFDVKALPDSRLASSFQP